MKLPAHLDNRASNGAKLVALSAERNKEIIGEKISKLLSKNAHVLEIASGTGQHGHHMCSLRSDIQWQYSDIDEDVFASQKAYATEIPAQLKPPIQIDTMAENWWQGIMGVDTFYCANMIHIAPWEAALGLAKGAGAILPQGKNLFLYGPFLQGDRSAQSNIDFDRNLKARNAQWGVRNLTSVKHIFADAGLNLTQTVDMPRDNFLLVFKRE